MEKHKWFWVMLFIFAVVLLAGLATSWNVAFVRNPKFKDIPWGILVLGSLGFIAVVVSTVMFFVRLLMEMRLNQLQSEFLAKISHELKSPITSLELTASMLRTDAKRHTEHDELWRIFDSELKRLNTEVNLILETSRWEAQPYKPALTKINLNEWVNNATSRWSAILGTGAAIEINNNLGNCHALIDTKLLDLISDNLVDNARKFSLDKPSLVIHANLSNKPNGDGLWSITFKDCGWGFEPKNKNKIFKRFYRAETGAPRAIAGTGLGLYLASQASKRMGVRLTAKSDGLGKGALFVMQGKAL